ncbi:MAG TPA: phosphoribosylanthranilate isomerase [Tepidisphaeraceae bacterium]|jgi:phosphoribosylanthranilate isomerase
MTRFKICCIADEVEAALAVRYGASCLGLVAQMPSGPGPIPDADIARIRRTIPPGVASFLLTCRQSADDIIAHVRMTGCNTIQICDRLTSGSYGAIREALPGVSIVQVIHVTGEESFVEAAELAPQVDAILLDSGRPNQAVKELGGTGRVHDWSVSRKIRESIEKPVFLAGGLNPGNAVEAIRAVAPYALDICSGVRTKGKLDEQKLAAFVAAIRAADTDAVPLR